VRRRQEVSWWRIDRGCSRDFWAAMGTGGSGDSDGASPCRAGGGGARGLPAVTSPPARHVRPAPAVSPSQGRNCGARMGGHGGGARRGSRDVPCRRRWAGAVNAGRTSLGGAGRGALMESWLDVSGVNRLKANFTWRWHYPVDYYKWRGKIGKGKNDRGRNPFAFIIRYRLAQSPCVATMSY
jgi:hypothetical protein